MKNKVKNFMLGVTMTLSISAVAQETIWHEDFTSPPAEVDEGYDPNSNGGASILAQQFISFNGSWTVEQPTTNGANSNVWYINAVESGAQLGDCSIGWNSMTMSKDYTLHIGKTPSVGDNGAFFTNAESTETDVMVVSPNISLIGKRDVTLNFSYLLGEFDSSTEFTVRYFNGTDWVDLPSLNTTANASCPAPRNHMWTSSPLYRLPSTMNNTGTFKIGFRFKSSVTTQYPIANNVSVAIDNIRINSSSMTEEKGNTAVSTLKQTTDAPVVSDPLKNITFTVFPNPNQGQFTVDFSGVENNHEVQILVFDSRDGRQLYSTSYYSNSLDHNRVDIIPETKIQPGRYVCALVCEGIRLNSTVIIN